jgi:co-chaperonin GroES (HSP10)
MDEELEVIKETKIEELFILKDFVLVEPDPRKDKTDSGVYLLPGTTTKNKNAGGDLRWGTIIKIGPEVEHVKVGDRFLMTGISMDFFLDEEKKVYSLMVESKGALYKKNEGIDTK